MTTAVPRDFWSRRRAAVRAEEAAEAEALRAADEAVAAAERERIEADKSDAELLDELGLQDPDTMQMGDDFSVFLQRAVPARIRQRALRRLWRTNPVLANLDGLVDHGEDFTDAAVTVPGMGSTYQVGRGMMRHLRALADAAEVEDTVEVEVEDAVREEIAADPESQETVTTFVAVDAGSEVPPDESALPPRRHMRFTFAGT